ncbi:MAG TPA: DUF4037 domain-containing protein, partial [Candidatus Obscuribacter sp.]|nr:DUF4037 domain-containing protein [Candidatus Obscuribacter sp.]
MSSFISGLDLSQSYFKEVVEPILRADFPKIAFPAGLLGAGSEVLGFDTEMSTDHDWGPRLSLFLPVADLTAYGGDIKRALGKKLPPLFRGYPTGFTVAPVGTQSAPLLDYAEAREEPVEHRVSVTSIADFIAQYLGFDLSQEIRSLDWLTFPEQKLLSLTGGRLFHDQIGIKKVLSRFAYYPQDVWLYLLACAWRRIEQEEHLMGRAGSVGDELGSRLIASRLVRDLMRLSFLMEKQYAPYPKWFGTAFGKLALAPELKPLLEQVLSQSVWQEREKFLVKAYELLAQHHRRLGVTEPLPTECSQFHDRPFLVISKGLY